MMNIKIIGSASAVILSLLGSSAAFAADGTAGTTFTEGKNTYQADASGTLFVTEDFDFNVSANVQLLPAETAQIVAVSAASTKGSYLYSGQSLGGAVTTCGDRTDIGTPPTLSAPSTTAGDGGCAGS